MKVKLKITKDDEVVFDSQIETGQLDSHGNIIMPGAFSGVPEQPYIIKRHYSKEETKSILDKMLNQPTPWSVGMHYDNPVRVIEEEIKPLKDGKRKPNI